jgi:CRP-like cAMP-binding protein
MLPSIRAIPLSGTGGTLRLSARDRAHLATIATPMRVPAGTVFYQRGDPADSIYCITSGTVCSYRSLANNVERIAAFFFAEDLFGLARRGVYVNSTRAVTATAVFRISLDALTGMLTANAGLQFRFLCKVTQTLREAQRRALVLTRRDPVERVLVFLSMMEEAQGARTERDSSIGLPMSMADIANFLNLPIGSVIAGFSALADRGIIARHDDGSVTVLDRSRFDVEGLDF